MHVVADLLMLAGAAWAVIAAAGVMRFDDVFGRLHAATKAPTLGLLLALAGAGLRLSGAEAVKLGLVGVLVFLTAPVGAHLISRAAHRRPGDSAVRIDTVDQLRAAETERAQNQPPDADRG